MRLAELLIALDPFRLLGSGCFGSERNHAGVVIGRLAGRGCNYSKVYRVSR